MLVLLLFFVFFLQLLSPWHDLQNQLGVEKRATINYISSYLHVAGTPGVLHVVVDVAAVAVTPLAQATREIQFAVLMN